MKKYTYILVNIIIIILMNVNIFGFDVTQPDQSNLKSDYGKFYSYIVLLFSENPHFLNQIQPESVPLRLLDQNQFNVNLYKVYLKHIKQKKYYNLAKSLLNLYLYPDNFSKKEIQTIENKLEKYNIILKFEKIYEDGTYKYSLKYAILGKKKYVSIEHPLFKIKQTIFNIQPLILYDEFLTSNSTFYYDMIYINPLEVMNDYKIALSVLNNRKGKNEFFVGAYVNDNIKTCLKKAFTNYKKNEIYREIWRMFEIHEITHKILHNKYYFYDQVIGEEIALVSTIYSNPFLGLAIFYSYLDYNFINPHRIAAYNFLKFISIYKNEKQYLEDPSLLTKLSSTELKEIAKKYFDTTMKNIRH